jgi:phosphatidylserine decarboxylase
MKIPLTKYGMPQVLVFPVCIILLMLAALLLAKFAPKWAIISIEIVLLLLLMFALAFFRDPNRVIVKDASLLLSPADGVVSDIEIIDDCEHIGEKTLRIGIFLNVFNVHINRTPCPVRIDGTLYKEGQFKNALDPESARVNESNAVMMTRLDEPKDKLIVRQISGAIARRIVCKVEPGQEFGAGQQFGMIKFGSRTELYLPAGDNVETMVKIGDKVRAGLTVMVKYLDESEGQ